MPANLRERLYRACAPRPNEAAPRAKTPRERGKLRRMRVSPRSGRQRENTGSAGSCAARDCVQRGAPCSAGLQAARGRRREKGPGSVTAPAPQANLRYERSGKPGPSRSMERDERVPCAGSAGGLSPHHAPPPQAAPSSSARNRPGRAAMPLRTRSARSARGSSSAGQRTSRPPRRARSPSWPRSPGAA